MVPLPEIHSRCSTLIGGCETDRCHGRGCLGSCRSSGTTIPVSNLLGNPLMDEGTSPSPGRRGAGRPSTVARVAPSIAEWLRQQPPLSSADIPRAIGLAGYRGGKRALYELVRRLRATGRRVNRSGLEHPRTRGE